MTGSADDATLRRALEQVLGEETVRTDDSILRTYSTDASPCAVEPRAVAFAESEDDVRAVLRVCRELEVPITPRASGTSLSGAAIGPGVVLDTTRFHRILEFERERRRIRVEPGILLAELTAYLAERGMRFAPDPAQVLTSGIGSESHSALREIRGQLGEEDARLDADAPPLPIELQDAMESGRVQDHAGTDRGARQGRAGCARGDRDLELATHPQDRADVVLGFGEGDGPRLDGTRARIGGVSPTDRIVGADFLRSDRVVQGSSKGRIVRGAGHPNGASTPTTHLPFSHGRVTDGGNNVSVAHRLRRFACPSTRIACGR